MERCLLELEVRPHDRDLIDEVFRTVHTIKGVTGFLGFSRLEAFAHAGENLLCALRAGRVEVSFAVVTGLFALLDELRAILQRIASDGSEGHCSTEDDSHLIGRLAALHMPDPFAATDAVVSYGVCPSEERDTVDQIKAGTPARTLLADPFSKRGLVAADRAEQRLLAQSPDLALRVDVDSLNRTINLVGELVLTRNQLLATSWAKENPELARRLDGITSALRNSAMQARMQPVAYLFGRFPRLVRDLAQICGRQVRLEFEGQASELDKTLLEAVRDPLTHAIRNAIDHGIEAPDERVLAGKNPEGVIRLCAYSENGMVVIEVRDDGAGIHPEKVVARAIERGVISPERGRQMSPPEVMNVLFEPGFTTAESVTSVSGRGVGLDVVRANIEKVGGSVQIESWPGLGTALRLRMPLTVAIIPAVVLRYAGHTFALSQNRVSELVYLSEQEADSAIETIGSARLLRLRNRLLPILRLDEILGLPAAPSPEIRGTYLVIVQTAESVYALQVEPFVSPEEIVVKPISPVLRESGLFLAAAVLASGDLALILDVIGLAARGGVRPTTDATRWPPSLSQIKEDDRHPAQQYLLCDAARPLAVEGQPSRFAVPLCAVERIVEIELAAVHIVRGRLVLQYNGELLPIEEPVDGVSELSLQDLRTMGSMALICHRAHRFALLVGRVLEICSIQTPGVAGSSTDVVLLHDCAVSVYTGTVDSTDLQEVA